MTLEQIKQKSTEITEKLEEELNDIPNNQSCINTKYPEKMWCSKRRIFAGYAVCENCEKYNSGDFN